VAEIGKGDLQDFYNDDRIFDHLIINDTLENATRRMTDIMATGNKRDASVEKLSPRFGAISITPFDAIA
jgi:hypothetical protein